MVKISIIMPLYNASKYLGECINSILGQTFTDFELLCINDASTDATMQMLQDFQKKDSRISIYSNTGRRGAAFSRNYGISVASGAYLAFLDGDDIFDETMLEKAYQTIEEKQADIVTYQYKHVSSDVIYHKLYRVHSDEYKKRYCSEPFALSQYEPSEVLHFPLGPWDKLYKRKLIVDNHLAFQDLPSGNDLYFVFMAVMLSKKTVMVEDDKVMVYVREHSESGRISNNRDPMCTYKAFKKVGYELINRNLFDTLYAHFYYRVFYSLRDAFLADNNEERLKSFYEFLQREGIDFFCSLDRQRYESLDEYIRNGFMRFINEDFESDWYKEENILKLFLAKNVKKVAALCKSFEKSGRKVAIWGAGENGKVLLSFCRQYNIRIDAVIDNAEEKQGQELSGYRIFSLQQVLDSVQVIIISACYIYNDVAKKVENRDIEVIDINQFLCIA